MERIQKLKDFLKEMPDDSFLNHALALEYIKIGNITEAKNLFEGVLKREPAYIGSYYHLGKLLEGMGNKDEALEIYSKGMAEAKKLKDNHAYNELQGVYEDLAD